MNTKIAIIINEIIQAIMKLFKLIKKNIKISL